MMSARLYALTFFIMILAKTHTKPALLPEVTSHIHEDSNSAVEKSRFETIAEEFEKMGNSANSMKSLTYVPTETSGCGQEFNFTLSAVTSSEFLLHAKLQLLLQRKGSHLPPSNYLVNIRMKLNNGTLRNESISRVLKPANSTHVEFEVTNLLKPLVAKESHGIFVIQAYKLLKSGKSFRKQLECGQEIEFVGNDSSQSSIPLLVVFTNDPNLNAVNYAAVERAYLEGEADATLQAIKSISSHRRQKRQTKAVCSKYPLIIPTDAITTEIIRGRIFIITSPVTYNAGICGGQCTFYTPRTTITHALVINLFFRLNDDNMHGYSLSQCCVPATYSPVVIYGYEPGASRVKLTLQNMSVNQCTCLDIVN